MIDDEIVREMRKAETRGPGALLRIEKARIVGKISVRFGIQFPDVNFARCEPSAGDRVR
jgi:hypothetical protein